MSKHEVVVVALRIIAVLLGLRAVDALPAVLATLFGGSGEDFGWWSVATISMIATYLVIAVLLWVFALPVGRLFLPKAFTDSPDTPLSSSLESVGFLILGTYLLSLAIPELVYGWMVFAQSKRILGGTWEAGPKEIAGIVSSLVKLAIALWVLLGAKGLRRLVVSLRADRGSSPSEPSD